MLKGTDRQHAGAIAFLVRIFGSRSTAGRVATPQDLSATKQHRNDRWDRCTASAGDLQIITTTSHRSANQRYFMHNSATVHRMRMQSSALDSSRSQLCNDTSTGVVRHQITKWRRLQKVVSYDVLHHMSTREACSSRVLALIDHCSDHEAPACSETLAHHGKTCEKYTKKKRTNVRRAQQRFNIRTLCRANSIICEFVRLR